MFACSIIKGMPPNLPDPMGKYGLHMMGWLAYRRKPEPEGGDHHA
jgi:hypothetical protein